MLHAIVKHKTVTLCCTLRWQFHKQIKRESVGDISMGKRISSVIRSTSNQQTDHFSLITIWKLSSQPHRAKHTSAHFHISTYMAARTTVIIYSYAILWVCSHSTNIHYIVFVLNYTLYKTVGRVVIWRHTVDKIIIQKKSNCGGSFFWESNRATFGM